jgi:hypothetical protein
MAVVADSLKVPFLQRSDTEGTVFSIGQTGSGGIAIQAESFGKDRTGQPGFAIDAESDVGEAVHAHASQSGIGVTASSGTGLAVWASSGGDPQMVINHVGSSGNPALWLEQDSQPKAYVWWGRTDNRLNFGTPTTNPILTLMDHGNVGIGTPTPSAKLEVNGDVAVTGDIRLLNADCAEDFAISGTDAIEPGTVMVIEQEGALQPSQQAYDKRVAGVISGAGDLKPGIILGKEQSPDKRMPIALLGKVYCRVDAHYSPIQVGDLLTTSPTPGHAMKADDPLKAFGAVIGKALRPLPEGQGLIPILIALQ